MSEPDDAKLAERKFMHDLATPISIALGQLEILMDPDMSPDPLTEGQKARLEKIKRAAERLRDMMAERRKTLMGRAPTED